MPTHNPRSRFGLWLAIVALTLMGVNTGVKEFSNDNNQEEAITDLQECVQRMAGLNYFPDTEPTEGGTELDNELISSGACPLPDGGPTRVVPKYNEATCPVDDGMIWDDESQTCAFTGMPAAPSAPED